MIQNEAEPLLQNQSSIDEQPSYSGNQPRYIMMEPKDRCATVYLVFYLLGLGSLLPWNFFITADDYWKYKFRNVDNSSAPPTAVTPAPNSSLTPPQNTSGVNVTMSPAAPMEYSELQAVWMNALSVCAMLPNVTFQFLNTLLQKRIGQNIRILGSLTAMIILFIVTTVFVKVNTDEWQSGFFTFTLLLVIVINSCTAIFQSSVFGLAACFPQKYSGAVMAGQGIGGMFAAAAMIIALSLTSDPTTSALIFFLTAIVVLSFTMLGYYLLIKMEFYKYYVNVANVPCTSTKEDEFDDVKYPEKDLEEKLCINDGTKSDDVWVDKNGEKMGKQHSNIEKDTLVENNNEKVEIHGTDGSSFWYVVKKVKLHAFCVSFTFFVTLACFPAVTATIKSMNYGSGSLWSDVYYTSVCCFLLFNLTDWLGRTLASYVHIPSKDSTTIFVLCVLSRAIFMVLFALCNAQPRSTPVVFHNDAFFIVFMILFGLSNGHFSTLSMQYGPKMVEPAHMSVAGSFLAFMIGVGLFAGAGFSFVLTKAIS